MNKPAIKANISSNKVNKNRVSTLPAAVRLKQLKASLQICAVQLRRRADSYAVSTRDKSTEARR